MPEHASRLPVPLWLFVADGIAALLLAAGLLLRSANAAGLPQRLPTLLIFLGGAGLIACAVAMARHLLAARRPPSR